MRNYNYKNKWQKLLTPEVVSLLTQIHEFKFCTGGRDYHRFSGGGDLFQERPVGKGTTGDLEEIKSVTDHPVDRNLIKRGAGGQQTAFVGALFHFDKGGFRKRGFGETFDILQIETLLIFRMDEGRDIAVLKLDRAAELRKLRRDFGITPDESFTVFNISGMVVCHFKDDQIAE